MLDGSRVKTAKWRQMLTDRTPGGKLQPGIRPGSAAEQVAGSRRVSGLPAIVPTMETFRMYEQPQLSTLVVLAFYAIAGVLAVIGGIMAVRARRKHKREHDQAR
jgi:hypothetical protein